MALIKKKTIKGYDAQYWRIVQLNSNFDRKDAVITLALYKDKATRDANSDAVVDQFQFDLGEDFSEALYSGLADNVKNIKLKKAYEIFMEKAVAEAEKEESNESLSWFADAVDG